MQFGGRKTMVKNEVPFYMEAQFCNDCKKNLLKKYIDIIDPGHHCYLGGASGPYLESVSCCPEVNECYPFYYQEAMRHILEPNCHWWISNLLPPNKFIELNNSTEDYKIR